MDQFDKAAQQVVGGAADPFDSAASQVLDGQRTALRASLYDSLLANPDVAARAVRLGRKTGLPAPLVERNLDEVQRNAQLNEFDRVLETSPHLAQFLMDPTRARLAHDDVQNLGEIERAARQYGELKASRGPDASLSTIARGLWRALPQGLEATRQGLRQQFADFFSFESMVEDARRKATANQTDVLLTDPQFEGSTARGLYSGGVSLMRQLPGLAASILTRSTAPALATAGLTTQTEAYSKYRNRGASAGEAFLGATGEGAVEVGTEMIPMGFLVEKLGKAGAGEFIKGYLGRELWTEQVATVLQDAIDTAVANPDKTWSDYLAERPDAAYQTALATLVQSGAMGAAHTVANYAARRQEVAEQRAQQADQGVEYLGKLNELAAASKVLQRDPETFEAFVAQAAEAGPVQDVFISAQTLAQSGIAEQLAAVSPAVASQLETALATGGDIRIPVAEYTTRIAPTEYAQSLLDHLKTDPEGFSRAEAQEYMQTQSEELKQEVERFLAEKEGDSTFKQSAETVRAAVKEQLDTAARFTPQVNDAYSAMVGNFYAVTAAKLGTTPEQLFQRYPLKVTAERIEGQQFEQGQSARGSFNPATLSITLLKNADLSTFHHESGHFFLEVTADITTQLQKDAEVFGRDTLKPGEQQILADTQALLDWFEVKSLDEWNGLDFEEKRAYHERFARGFEAYLFEGKAPSIELQGLFQRFRAWLLAVYRELKNLNVELTDEVRGVFDRMLATNEQIALAEQGRSMMPLFTSAEQAGMTPEEFAAYQALGVDATNEAIEDLQARGLRDMQWIHNARGRIIKRLQKESAEKRAEVQMEVRREVMSQPLYRAWQFLTGKQTTDDQVESPKPPKSDPNTLDETMDSLFVAIAKLGGLNKDEVVETWGTDPADKPASGVFGKPVWRREGGLSIDGMAEALGQYGYLTKDENGKVDLAEFERLFDSELRGSPAYSSAYAPEQFATSKPGEQIANPGAPLAGRLDRASLAEMGLPAEIVAHLDKLRMVRKEGMHPDVVADIFGFTSGDELVRRLAAAEAPKAEIEALTDVRMLERYGDLSSPEAIERAADKAIHNDARARMISTEANALAKATGQRKVLTSAAKEFARAMIARLKVRDIRPGQYANAEVRAAKAAEKASKSGDLATAAAEKRNRLVNNYAARAAYDAQDEVEKGLRYLKKFDSDATRKGIDADYTGQIDALLERFDLRKGQSNKAIDKRTTLAKWIEAQREAGLEPDIPDALEDEAFRTSYKNLTVEEFRGLVDTVRQIEHLGRLKHRLLTARDQRAYEAVRDEIVASIDANAQGREADTRTPTTNLGRAVQGLKRFWASHIKAATWARVMDGGKDGGPMWEYFVRSANERGDMETTLRAEATAKLSEILAPVFALGKMGGKGQFFPSIGRSLNREARLAIALNTGNAGNLQRLLGGEGWTVAQITPVLQSLTAQEWQAVQAVWDHFESYRPQIAAKERRIYGKEPEWVAPQPFAVTTADGQTVQMRGGYYPIKYDPAASQRAEEHADAEGAKRQLQGAYTTATTRRSFTKGRVEEVAGRPLLYTLSGLYSGVNDVIHDLAWHEWLIDANRLMRSKSIDGAIREHYGPEAKQQFKTWAADIAEGEKGADAAVDLALSRLRQGVSAAGLGFNVMSALIQPLGITQSIVRVGAPWVGRGVMKYIANPLALTREVVGKSSFMENRARTRFRELNELRNQVQDQTAFRELTGRYAYFLMMRCQQMVDVPTWWGAYEKVIAEGNDEERAVSLADQAVIDAQGGGQTKDLSAIERGGPAQKLFTVFYSFMNTALNVGVSQTMAADTPAKKAKLAADYALLYVVPAVLGYFLKNAITPGDSGDDDLEKIAKKLAANQIDYLMGLMVVVREFGEAAKTLAGANDLGRDYTGPAGLRLVADSVGLAKQTAQGEFDDAFRKAAVNVVGDLFGLPAAQINRTVTGTQALAEGKTSNPAALAFGFQERR